MASDLHTHTNFSDGFFSPAELVEKAREVGIKNLAITDHDTIEGFEDLGEVEGIRVIPGVEISAKHPNHGQLHIIGLKIDVSNPTLKTKLEEFAGWRFNRAKKIIEKLNENGYKITLEEVREYNGNPKTIVRNHIALTLESKRYFESARDAYRETLKRGQLAYVPLKHPPIDEAISLIHQAGGLAILAHPKLVKDDELVEEVAKKVDGIEVYYPKHSWMDEQCYIEIARKYNLKISGGSDFHGTPEDRKHPKEIGAFTVEDRIVEEWL